MSNYITVGSNVKFNDLFFQNNRTYTRINQYKGKVGKVIVDDKSYKPYKVQMSDGITFWAYTSEVTLVAVDMQSFTTYSVHKLLSILLKGEVLYTANGTKVHNKDGVLMFNKSPLNWNKVIDLPLSYTEPSKPDPFTIDKVMGTHCKVWDDDENDFTFELINGYIPDASCKYKAVSGLRWKNAVPVK